MAASIKQGDGEYRTTLEGLISLASRAFRAFEKPSKSANSSLCVFEPAAQRKKLEFSLRSPFDLMVDRRSYSSWLGFLNTVRTERFEQVLAWRPSLLAIAMAAHG